MAFALPTNCDEGLMICLAQWSYNVTNGMFWALILLAFTVILYMTTFRYGTPRAFGFASVAGMVGAIWLGIMELLSWWIASAFIIAGFIGFAVMILSEK